MSRRSPATMVIVPGLISIDDTGASPTVITRAVDDLFPARSAAAIVTRFGPSATMTVHANRLPLSTATMPLQLTASSPDSSATPPRTVTDVVPGGTKDPSTGAYTCTD